MNNADGRDIVDPEARVMAYVDGELEPGPRADFERTAATDPALQARIATLQAQRGRVEAAFAPVLDEPVPDRLTALLAATARPAPSAGAAGKVVDLAAARAASTTRAAPQQPRPLAGWAAWGGMAASLLLGLLLGTQWAGRGSDEAFALRGGQLIAGAALEQALSTQLAGAAASAVEVQFSFVDRNGAHCRTFSTGALAGLACRREGQWAVQTVAEAAPEARGAMRQAGSPLPRAVLDTVDQRIQGEVLDAAGERRARDRGWTP